MLVRLIFTVYTMLTMMNELLNTVRASYERIGAPKRILLALSGGADSVFLFRVLVELQHVLSYQLRCIHVNHGLRAEAEDDQVFVQLLCDQFHVLLSIKPVMVCGDSNIEANARKARYAVFRQEAEEWQADAIALAHHQDDQAETVLLRLLHGTGGQGLAAMREWRDSLWRPLLSVRSDTIQQTLTLLGQGWVTDASNTDMRFTRNRIRTEAVPALQKINDSFVPNAARTADILGAESDYWAQYADAWLAKHASMHPACSYLSLSPFHDLHVAAQRQVLRRICEAINVELDFMQLERLRVQVDAPKGSMLNLPKLARALCGREHMHFEFAGGDMLPLGEIVPHTHSLLDERISRTETFAVDKASGAVLRYRQAGDIITPLGGPGSKKLSDYLIDRKVDRPFRKHWPVYCKGNVVLWVPGVGMAQEAAVGEETRETITLRYVGRLPDEYIGYGGEAL